MKIRNGFVSNSSTTSFCMYGICDDQGSILKRLDVEVLKNLAEVRYNGENDYYRKRFPTFEEYWKHAYLDDDDESLTDDLYEVMELLSDISVYTPEYGDAYMGLSYPGILDDETGGEFKQRAVDTLRKIIPDIKEDEFSTLQDAWRDG